MVVDCRECGEPFEVFRTVRRGRPPTTCSDECRLRARGLLTPEERAERKATRMARAEARFIRTHPVKPCRHCGTPFQSLGHNAVAFCSDECRATVAAEIKRRGVKLWKKANPDKVEAQRVRGYMRNPERIREKSKRWAINNPERRAANLKRRHERVRKVRAVFAELVKMNPELQDILPKGSGHESYLLTALKQIGIEIEA